MQARRLGVALSNNRLIDTSNGGVRFRWKDYRTPDAADKIMALSAFEFIRRSLLHVLPPGFQRIRYFGFLGNRHRAERLTHCRALLGTPETAAATAIASDDYRDRYESVTGRSLRACPFCRQGHMILVEYLERRHPIATLTDTS